MAARLTRSNVWTVHFACAVANRMLRDLKASGEVVDEGVMVDT